MADRTIAVIDGNSLLHRGFHALPETMTAPDGRPTNAVFGFISMLVKLASDLRPDAIIVAFDLGKPAFRMEVLEQYKINRPPMHDSLRQQFPMVKKLLESLSVPIVELQGWEGDDILGTLARRGEALGDIMLLVTGDRDAFQLVTDRVKVVTTRKGVTDIVIYGPAEVEERYGLTPRQVPDFLGLKGDTSDNIPGVPGVGDKTAAKLLQQYGSLDATLEAAARGEIPGKVGSNLVEHAEVARASRTVATIVCDVPLDFDFERPSFGEFDPAAAAHAFGELRMTTLFERVLALKASRGGRAVEVAAELAPVPERESRPLLRGDAASRKVDEWMADSNSGWLGIAVEAPTDTLFGESAQLAVAGPDSVALIDVDKTDATLVSLIASGRIAAGDAKGLLQRVCPADEGVSCAVRAEEVDPARLFDVAIGGYLMESGRSSYDVRALAADYLSSPLPPASEDRPESAVVAEGIFDVAAEIERRLDEDGSLSVFRDIEMPLVPVLLGMERVGVGVDPEVLRSLSEETRAGIDALRHEIHDMAGYEFTVDSPKQLAEVLFEKLGLPTQKKTKTGYSTDASVLAALAPIHPIAEKIIAYRELTKLTSTYIDALPRLLGADGRLHTSFNQTVAATGRLSSSNPNLQNIPVRTELGKRIRAAFVPAQPGDVMVAADYSQIELRILAHLSEDEGLIHAFTSGRDFHTATAARVFGIAPEDVTPVQRGRAKAVNFGIVYGISAHGLAPKLGVGNAEAQATIDRYYAAYPQVREYLDRVVADAHRDGYAITMFGRKRHIPELRSSNYQLRSFGERTAMNHPMQGTAADIMKLAMIEVDRRLREQRLSARMVLQVHDELVFEAPPGEVEALSATVCEAMAGVAEMRVPLLVSTGSGPDWASAK